MPELTADPHFMTRKQMIQFLDINPETFDNWCKDLNMPRSNTEPDSKQTWHLGDVIRWRILKEKQDKKDKKIKEALAKEPGAIIDDKEAMLREKILVQDLRKKTIENDEREGLLVNKKQMEDLFFRLGRGVRDNLMSKPQVYGPQLEGLTAFDITTYLRKEFEKLCNSLADLNHISDHDYALELHEMFVLGFNYGKAS
jgi:phage terminase Nu1 subunit (DNA packaging protein)